MDRTSLAVPSTATLAEPDIAPFVAAALGQHLAGAEDGHAVRVNDLEAALARDVIPHLLRTAKEAGVKAALTAKILGVAEADDGLTIPTDKAIELRNRKQGVLCLFVPAGAHSGVASSLGNAFAEIDGAQMIQDALNSYARDLSPQSPLRKALAAIRSLYYQSPASQRPAAIDQLKFAVAAADELHRVPAAPIGLGLCRIGLLPDAGPDFVDRLRRNRSTVTALSRPRKITAMLEERIAGLKLTLETERQVRGVLQQSRLETPKVWTQTFGRPPAPTFDQWEFIENAEPSDCREITVQPFLDEQSKLITANGKGLSQDHEGGPLWATIGEKSKLSVKWQTVPTKTTVPRWRIEIVPADAQDAWSDALIELPSIEVKRSGARTASLNLNLQVTEDDDLPRVPLRFAVRAIAESGEELATDDGTALEAFSDDFYLRKQGGDVEPAARERGSTAATLPAGLLAFVATKAEEFPTSLERATTTTSGAIIQFSLKVSERDSITVSRSAALDNLQAAILGTPEHLGTRQLVLEEPTMPAISADRIDDVYVPAPLPAITSDAGRQFLSARRTFFTRIRQAAGARNRIELAPWEQEQPSLTDAAKRYANAWSAWLESASGEELAAVLQVDTLHVRIGDSPRALVDALIVAPTHPLRALWFASQAALFRTWSSLLLEVQQPRHRAQLVDLDMANTVQPINVPSVLHHPTTTEPYIFARNLEAGYGVAFSPEGQNPLAQFSVLAALLGIPTTSAGQNAAPSQRMADALNRFEDLHPYADPLRIGLVNPGDGRLFVGALNRWEDDRRRNLLRAQAGVQDTAAEEQQRRPGRPTKVPDDDPGDLVIPEPPALQITAFASEPADIALAFDRYRQERAERVMTAPSDHLRPALALWTQPITGLNGSAASAPLQQHVTILHDITSPRPVAEAWDVTTPERAGLELHGLVVRYSTQLLEDDDQTRLVSWINLEATPTPHPADKGLSDTMLRAHREAAAATIRHIAPDRVPSASLRLALLTQVDRSARDLIRQTHATSDWVITLDRFMGPELLDRPDRQLPDGKVERTYILDSTPDPQDGLGHRSFVTTSSRAEIEAMLTRAMGSYGFEQLDESAGKLVQTLRTVSGRLVLDALSSEIRAAEVVGLGAVVALLRAEGKLGDALIVPIDEHLPIFRPPLGSRGTAFSRCDLALVRFPTARKLHFTLIEVKSRSNLTGSLDALADTMARQMRDTGEAIVARSANPDRVDQVLQRAGLAHVLAFYLQRAVRFHLLDPAMIPILAKRIGSLDRTADLDIETVHEGYVIALGEGASPSTQIIDDITTVRVLTIPEIACAAVDQTFPAAEAATVGDNPPPASPSTVPEQLFPEPSPRPTPADQGAPDTTRVTDVSEPDATPTPPDTRSVQDVVLGTVNDTSVIWKPRVEGSPHVFVIGIPGQGKSVTIERILLELAASGTPAFILDFHGTLADPASAYVQQARPVVLDASEGLPFSPFAIDPRSNQMAVAQHTREIMNVVDHVFNLGPIQADLFYKELYRLYRQRGYGASRDGQEPQSLPTFAALGRALERAEKDQGVRNLLARTRMLFDFDLFTPSEENPTQFNELLQRGLVVALNRLGGDEIPLALSSFLVRQIYLSMTSWPISERIRLVIVLDEAHRLAKDTTLPKLMKEGRKYGVAVVIASQSISDFHTDIPANAGTKISFRVNNPESRKVAQYFGGSTGTDFATVLENLHVGQALVQTPEMPRALRTAMLKPSDSLESTRG